MTFWPRLADETGATRAGPDPGELRGPGDLRLAAAARRAEVLRQQARRLGADLDADRDAHAGRAGLALAGHQPAAAAGQPGHRRAVRRPGAGHDGAAARADVGPRARGLPGPARPAYERRGVPEDLASRVAVLAPAYMLLGIVETAQREELAPEEVARVHFALGERLGAAGAAAADRGAAARRQVADDGPRRAARRPARRAHPAHRAGAAQHRRPTTPRRPGSRPGRRATASWSPGPRRPWSRSAPTRRATWRGCRSGCGWCGDCCRRKHQISISPCRRADLRSLTMATLEHADPPAGIHSLWRLRGYLRPHVRALSVMAAAAVGAVGLTITIPLVTKAIIDGPITDRDLGALLPLGLLALGARRARGGPDLGAPLGAVRRGARPRDRDPARPLRAAPGSCR